MTLKESKKVHKGRLRGTKVKGKMMQLYYIISIIIIKHRRNSSTSIIQMNVKA